MDASEIHKFSTVIIHNHFNFLPESACIIVDLIDDDEQGLVSFVLFQI